MDDFQLTTRPIVKLRKVHRQLRDARLAYCIQAIVLPDSRWNVAHVARALLIDEKTVRLWLETHRQGGENERLTLNYQGKEPLLTAEQPTELAQHPGERTYLDSHAIRNHIETTCSVKYSPTGVKDTEAG